MTKKECALEKFLYHEYNVYLDLAKKSEEDRDGYIRLYSILLTALMAFMSSKYYESSKDFFELPIFLSFLVISLVTYLIVLSARIGNTRCIKRINILRGYLRKISCKDIQEFDRILLPTSSDEREYFNPLSVSVILLFLLSIIMAISAFFVAYLLFDKTCISLLSSFIVGLCLASYFIFRLRCRDHEDEKKLSEARKMIDNRMKELKCYRKFGCK